MIKTPQRSAETAEQTRMTFSDKKRFFEKESTLTVGAPGGEKLKQETIPDSSGYTSLLEK